MQKIIVVLTIAVFVSSVFAALPAGDYIPGRAMINFTAELPLLQISVERGIVKLGIPDLDAVAHEFNISSMEKVFPGENRPDNPLLVDLSRWYYVTFPAEIAVEDVLMAYMGNSFIEHVDYHMLREYCYTPNDPLLTNCWHLFNIQADSAWEITKGKEEIVIALVDTGIDTAHIDLKDQMWINYGEDANGDSIINIWDWNYVDDDQSGYIDDFWGWDFIENDNTPHDTEGHGTLCAGAASADTDNDEGIAGTGFNTRLMNLRCGIAGSIQFGLQGINYAATTGADIISLSYSSPFYWVPEQQAIQAAWQYGSVICAAAGNDNSTMFTYPASYVNVVGVGSTDFDDRKASFSNYNSAAGGMYNVDVMAPGVSILTTQLGGGYIAVSGTSLSSAICSGVLALICSVSPEGYTNAGVVQTLFDTVDDIYPVNPGYQYGQLGYGRINAFNAVLSLSPYLSLESLEITDDGNNDGRADPGETVELTISIFNDLRAQMAADVTGTLNCADPAVDLIVNTGSFGDINPGTTASNSSPYVFEALNSEPHFAEFELGLVIGDGRNFNIPFELEIGRPPILLVDDDGPDDNSELFYLWDFEELGLFVDYWEQNSAPIPQEEIDRYEVVIWETGFSDSTLDASEQAILQNYLDNGSTNLLFTSTNAGPDIGNTTFYSDYLHASFVGDEVTEVFIDGIEGNAISEGMELFLIGSTGSGNIASLEAVNPLGNAEICFVYQNQNLNAALNCEFANGSRVVYLAFPLDAVTYSIFTSRLEVLTSILDWFMPTPAPQIELSADEIDFGEIQVGSQSETPLTIYNTGDSDLILYAVSSGDPVFFTDYNQADSIVTPGDSLLINVYFEPEENIVYSDILMVENNDQLEEVVLTGSGIMSFMISLTPYNPPVIIPETGGSFDFNIAAENQSSAAVTNDIWTIIELPATGTVGPLILVEDMVFAAGSSADRDRTQEVPSFAPPGIYAYYAFAGVYPWVIEYSASFNFEKTGVNGAGFMGGPADWSCSGEIFDSELVSGISPQSFWLRQPHPNPFNNETNIAFELPQTSNITLMIFDVQGREVMTLIAGVYPAGIHEVKFDSEGVSSGCYFAHLQAGTFVQTRKMLLLK